MAPAPKKGGKVESRMGRPAKGALSTYAPVLVQRIKDLRMANPGWGAQTILIELETVYGYAAVALPSIAAVNRFLKQAGLVKANEPHGRLPKTRCAAPQVVHELWEMDAQGAVQVSGLGYQVMINIKDSLSKKYCMAFPIPVRHTLCAPTFTHYQWACRMGFLESGMPQAIQVDKDSVFYENTTKSPYPTHLHLWLISLGVKLCIINSRPPHKQAMVERSHQTIERQALQGQHFPYWKVLFSHCNERRQRLNENIPSRSLDHMAPLQAFPQARHSGRPFCLEKEYDLVMLERIYEFLALGQWYRRTSKNKMVSLGGQRYYLKNATPHSQLQITFCKQTRQFIFRDVNEQIIDQQPPKGLSKQEIIGVKSVKLKTTHQKLLRGNDFCL